MVFMFFLERTKCLFCSFLILAEFSMTVEKNGPAFQYYPADLLNDVDVMFWSADEVGCYWLLISHMWINNGSFPENFSKLSKIFRKKSLKTTKNIWQTIRKKFQVFEKDGENFIRHKRVDKMMEVQAKKRLERSESGKKGADKRWHSHSLAITPAIAKNSSSSSSSSSSSYKKEKEEKESSLFPFVETEESKNSLHAEQEEFDETIWPIYPGPPSSKGSKKLGRAKYVDLRPKHSVEYLKSCVLNYKKTLKIESWRSPMMVSKFFGPSEHFQTFSPQTWEPPKPKDSKKANSEPETDHPSYVN